MSRPRQFGTGLKICLSFLPILILSCFWKSGSHLEAASVGFDLVAGVIELTLAIWFFRVVFVLKITPTEEMKERKEQLEAALGLVAAIFFIFATVASLRIHILSERERIESEIERKESRDKIKELETRIADRSISQDQMDGFKSLLINAPKKSVWIVVNSQTPETQKLARTIRQMLDDSGYTATGGVPSAFGGGGGGAGIWDLTWPLPVEIDALSKGAIGSLTFSILDEHSLPPYGLALSDAFKGAGIKMSRSFVDFVGKGDAVIIILGKEGF